MPSRDAATAFEQRRQEVYDAAMTGAIQKLDTMPRKTVESLAQCAGIVGAAAQSLLDYYQEHDEKLRLAAEARREFQEAPVAALERIGIKERWKHDYPGRGFQG